MKIGIPIKKGFFSSFSVFFHSGLEISLLTHRTKNEHYAALFLLALKGETSKIFEVAQTFNLKLSIRNNNRENLIHWAAMGGAFETIEALEQRGVDPKEKNLSGFSLLHFAALGGHDNLIKQLISKYYFLHPLSLTEQGYTLSHCAALGGHLELVQRFEEEFLISPYANTFSGFDLSHLIAKWANVNDLNSFTTLFPKLEPFKKNNLNQSILHVAAYYGNIPFILGLLQGDHNKGIHSVDKLGRDLLFSAASGGRVKTIVFLVEKFNFKLMAKDNNGQNILHADAHEGRIDTILSLLEIYSQLDPLEKDNHGNTLVHSASAGGHSEIIKKLKSALNLNPLALNNHNENIFQVALSCGKFLSANKIKRQFPQLSISSEPLSIYQIMLKLLMLGDFDEVKKAIKYYPVLKDQLSLELAYKLLYRLAESNRYKIIPKFSRFFQLSVSEVDQNGWGCLQHAAYTGNVPGIQFLVNKCSLDPLIKDKELWSLAFISAYGGKEDALYQTLKSYPKITLFSLDKNWRNISQVALLVGQIDISKSLMKRHPSLDVLMPYKNNLTVLDELAIHKNDIDKVFALCLHFPEFLRVIFKTGKKLFLSKVNQDTRNVIDNIIRFRSRFKTRKLNHFDTEDILISSLMGTIYNFDDKYQKKYLRLPVVGGYSIMFWAANNKKFSLMTCLFEMGDRLTMSEINELNSHGYAHYHISLFLNDICSDNLNYSDAYILSLILEFALNNQSKFQTKARFLLLEGLITGQIKPGCINDDPKLDDLAPVGNIKDEFSCPKMKRTKAILIVKLACSLGKLNLASTYLLTLIQNNKKLGLAMLDSSDGYQENLLTLLLSLIDSLNDDYNCSMQGEIKHAETEVLCHSLSNMSLTQSLNEKGEKGKKLLSRKGLVV